MTEKFPLIQELGEIERNPDKKSPLPKGVKYEKHTVLVDNQETEVFIPLRESEAFKNTVAEYGNRIAHADLGIILRKHRGVRNWE